MQITYGKKTGLGWMLMADGSSYVGQFQRGEVSIDSAYSTCVQMTNFDFNSLLVLVVECHSTGFPSYHDQSRKPAVQD